MSVTVNLVKGQTVNLSKETNGSQKFQLRAGWDTSLSGTAVDIDIMSAEINTSDVGVDFIYFGNMKSKDGAIKLSGDNRTGEGSGWDETILLDGGNLSSEVKRIPCIVSIYDAIGRGQNFGLVRNLKVQIFDETNNVAIADYEPELEFGTDTAVVLGEFVVSNGNIYFKPLGKGYSTIQDILKEYKINY